VISVKGNEYAYLAFREGKKVVQKYLGSIHKPEVQEVVKQGEERKRIKSEYREVKKDLKEIERMLGGRKAV